MSPSAPSSDFEEQAKTAFFFLVERYGFQIAHSTEERVDFERAEVRIVVSLEKRDLFVDISSTEPNLLRRTTLGLYELVRCEPALQRADGAAQLPFGMVAAPAIPRKHA